MTILAIGLDCDPTIVYFVRQCRRRGVDVDVINIRDVADRGRWALSVPPGKGDEIAVDEKVWRLDDYHSIYARMIDLTEYQCSERAQARWYGLMAGMSKWLQTSGKVVVNRPFSGLHNSAKPLHESVLSGFGFAVPDSVTTSDRSVLEAFVGDREVVSKSMAGGRVDARALRKDAFAGYRAWMGPVHVQHLVRGFDVRAHVIDASVVSIAIRATGVDYRVVGQVPSFTRNEIPRDLADRLVRATRALNLVLAGWDFKVDSLGRYWCLEANPQPGYSFYDTKVDGEISDVLIKYLTGCGTGAAS